MNRISQPRNPLLQILNVSVRLYLVLFLVAACAPRRPPVSTVEARSMETRVVQADYNKVLKASVNVLQDLRYTIDVIDSDLGLIVASRVTEGMEAELAKEPDQVPEVATWKKVLGITIIIAIVAGIIWLISGGGGDGDDDDHSSRGRGRTTHVYNGNDSSDGPRIYQYKVTLNIESLSDGETNVRVSGAGERRRGDTIEVAGPVEDPEFFTRFYSALDKALFLEN
ncbi:hypothetical protein ACFL5M_00185 [Candidatus Neomarinimicrobiota bacterium]